MRTERTQKNSAVYFAIRRSAQYLTIRPKARGVLGYLHRRRSSLVPWLVMSGVGRAGLCFCRPCIVWPSLQMKMPSESGGIAAPISSPTSTPTPTSLLPRRRGSFCVTPRLDINASPAPHNKARKYGGCSCGGHRRDRTCAALIMFKCFDPKSDYPRKANIRTERPAVDTRF